MTPRSKTAGRKNLAEMGVKPRGLSIAEAAAYAGVSAPTFRRLVEDGRMPASLPLGDVDRQVWDRDAVDAAMDSMGKGSTRHADPIESGHRVTDEEG